MRTQIYLTPEQRKLLDERAKSRGTTMAQVIRDAIDRYLEERRIDDILERTFGMAPDMEYPSRAEDDREF